MSGALFNEPGTWETLKAARRAATEPDEVVPVPAFLACRVLAELRPSERDILLALWRKRDHTTCVVRVAISQGPEALSLPRSTFATAWSRLLQRGLVRVMPRLSGDLHDHVEVLPGYRYDPEKNVFYLGPPVESSNDSTNPRRFVRDFGAGVDATKETRARCLAGSQEDTRGGYADWREAFADVAAIKRVGWSFFAEWGMPAHEIDRLKAAGVTLGEAAHAASDMAENRYIRNGWSALVGRLMKRRQQQAFRASPGRDVARLQSIRDQRRGGGHPLEVRAWGGHAAGGPLKTGAARGSDGGGE